MREGGQDAVMGITWAEYISMRIASPKFSVADNDHVGGIVRAAPFQGDDVTLNSQDIEKSKNATPTVTRKVADQQYDDGASSCPIASTGGSAISTSSSTNASSSATSRGCSSRIPSNIIWPPSSKIIWPRKRMSTPPNEKRRLKNGRISPGRRTNRNVNFAMSLGSEVDEAFDNERDAADVKKDDLLLVEGEGESEAAVEEPRVELKLRELKKICGIVLPSSTILH